MSSDDTSPSSPIPADNAVFSDEPVRVSSPPSSPPGFPWEKQDTSDAPTASQRPTVSAFSLLGKRKPLDNISDNARPAKKAARASSKPTTEKPLTQMQISLGQQVQKKCPQCGMEYVASSAEDRKLHDKYHKRNTEGYDVGKDFVQRARGGTVFKGAIAADSICAVDCWDKYTRRKRAQAALDVVQKELGAVPIDEKMIWDVKDSGALSVTGPHFGVLMYIRGTKCVGFLLLEKITEAYRVVEPASATKKEATQPSAYKKNKGASTALAALKARQHAAEEALRAAEGQPIELSTNKHPSRLGISRIWTSPTHRHQNIATTLLDTAISHHDQRAQERERDLEAYRRKPPDPEISAINQASVKALMEESMSEPERLRGGKEDVAFSQPTEAGARLARRWFGKAYGWSVYVD